LQMGPKKVPKMEVKNGTKNDGQKYVQNRVQDEEGNIAF
jgi:hypothetical protein